MIGDQWIALLVAAIAVFWLDAWRRKIRERAPRWVNIVAMLCEIEIIVGTAYSQYSLYRAMHALESTEGSNKATMLAGGISSAMNSNAIAVGGVLVAILVLGIGSRSKPSPPSATLKA